MQFSNRTLLGYLHFENFCYRKDRVENKEKIAEG
jgi:hypothetical protein